jgi:alpha-L-fucosidase
VSRIEEDYLRNIAAWYFINHEAIDNVRPWIVTNEDDIWLSKSKDEDVVYAYLTNLPEWERGSRKAFVIGSVEATKDTRISVLGQNSRVVEYNPGNNPEARFEQKKDGLHISVVRAQRIYNNNKWPHPVVVKLENVQPALSPPVVNTVSAKMVGGEMIVTGEVVDAGDGKNLQAGVEFKESMGFVEELYHNTWERTSFIPIDGKGTFEIKVPGLTEGKNYQFKAIVKHPKLVVKGGIVKKTFSK